MERSTVGVVTSVAARQSWSETARDLWILTKPRVTLLVFLTAAAGSWLAPGHLGPLAAWVAALGMVLVVGSANALNCWLERDSDALMRRTRNRPLPAGRLEPGLALLFGLALGGISVPALTLATNPLTGALSLLALVSYTCIYTPLKQRSAWALPAGAVPGAIPPLMGWTAVTGRLDVSGLVLFGILFFWQLPHFIAIAIFRKSEYVRAGMQVLPAVAGNRAALWHATAYAGLLVLVTLLLVPLGTAGTGYLVAAALLGAAFLALTASGLWLGPDERWARRVFFGSLLYLPLLFAVLLLDAA